MVIQQYIIIIFSLFLNICLKIFFQPFFIFSVFTFWGTGHLGMHVSKPGLQIIPNAQNRIEIGHSISECNNFEKKKRNKKYNGYGYENSAKKDKKSAKINRNYLCY